MIPQFYLHLRSGETYCGKSEQSESKIPQTPHALRPCDVFLMVLAPNYALNVQKVWQCDFHLFLNRLLRIREKLHDSQLPAEPELVNRTISWEVFVPRCDIDSRHLI